MISIRELNHSTLSCVLFLTEVVYVTRNLYLGSRVVQSPGGESPVQTIQLQWDDQLALTHNQAVPWWVKFPADDSLCFPVKKPNIPLDQINDGKKRRNCEAWIKIKLNSDTSAECLQTPHQLPLISRVFRAPMTSSRTSPAPMTSSRTSPAPRMSSHRPKMPRRRFRCVPEARRRFQRAPNQGEGSNARPSPEEGSANHGWRQVGGATLVDYINWFTSSIYISPFCTIIQTFVLFMLWFQLEN